LTYWRHNRIIEMSKGQGNRI